MDRAAAKVRLQAMTAWDSSPALSDAQVEALLDLARREDSGGLVYTDTGWTGTYALDAAAAEGWRWKASLAAGMFSFSADGGSFDKAAVHEHCMEQAKQYAGRGGFMVMGDAFVDPLAGAVLGNWNANA